MWICMLMLVLNFKNLLLVYIVMVEFDFERDEGEVYGLKMLVVGN